MLFGLIAGTLSVLVTLLLLAAVFAGLGLLVRRGLGLRPVGVRDLFVAFWVGLAGAVLLLILWNFLWPINAGPLLVVGALGVWGLAVARREIRGLVTRERWCRTLWAPILLILSAAWIANLARGSMTNWDTALYHLQGMLWAKQYAVVPGLANLFGALAFNNVSLLYAAMLDIGPWAGRAFHLANGLLLLVLLWQGLLGLIRVARSEGLDRVQGLFEAVLIAPVVNRTLSGRVTSYVTDLPTALVLFAAASQMHLMLLIPDDEPREVAYRGFVSLTLLAVAVTFKMSAAILAAAAGVLVAGWLLLRVRLPARVRVRAGVWSFAVVLCLALGWMGRGVVLSGYPLFPIDRFPFPVDWRAPDALVRGEYAFAAHSSFATAESPSAILGEMRFQEWLPRWWSQSGNEDLHYVAFPFAILILAAGAWLVLRLRRESQDEGAATWWLALPAAIAAVGWFLLAPEPRYSGPFFWTLAATSLAALFRISGGALGIRWREFATFVLVLGLSPTLIHPLFESGRKSHSPLRRIVEENLLLPGPAVWLRPIGGHPEISPYRTESGLVLNVPQDLCWDAPLPCTRNPAPNLRLRVPDDLSHGFAVDGPWAMEDWPAPRRTVFRKAWAEHERRRNQP